MAVLDAHRGAVLSTVVVGGNPGPAAVDERRGHVFVLDAPGDADGRVRVLDAGTGAALRTIRVGMGPLAVAVDERTGYAFRRRSTRCLGLPCPGNPAKRRQ